jgi:hypothetical protein
MLPFDEAEVERLIRDAVEEDDAVIDASPKETLCGSYASLALLMAGRGSSFVPASHLSECAECQRMLIRLLARRCPSTDVLKQYRKSESDFARVAALGWHIVGCKWCKLRLAFSPKFADSHSQLQFEDAAPGNIASAWRHRPAFTKYSVAIAYSIALLALGGCMWLGFSLRHEQRVVADRESQWQEATGQAENRIRALTEQIQKLGSQQTALVQAPESLGKQTQPREIGIHSKPAIRPLIASFTLSAGSLRDEGGLNEFSIPAGATVARLKIPLSSSDYEKYRVTLKKPEGEQLFVHDLQAADGKLLVVDVPARLLSAGDYILAVGGIDHSGDTQVVENYGIRFTRLP